MTVTENTMAITFDNGESKTIEADYFNFSSGWVLFKMDDHKAVAAYPQASVVGIEVNEAAGSLPSMLADAWEKGAAAGLGWDENRGEDFNAPNPYRPAP